MTDLRQKLATIRRRELETGYLTYENPLRYGPKQEWLIYNNEMGCPAGHRFAFQHESYDGAPDANDHRCGTGISEHDCILQINEKILEEMDGTPHWENGNPQENYDASDCPDFKAKETPPAGSIEGVS